MKYELANYDIRINSAGRFESYKQGVWNPPPVLRDYDLMVYTSGVGSCQISGQPHAVARGDVLLLRRGDTVEDARSAGRMNNLFVHFDFLSEKGDPVDPPAELLPPRTPEQVDFVVITRLVQSLMSCLGETLAVQAIFHTILLLISGRPEPPIAEPSIAHRSRLFAEFSNRILRHPGERMSVSGLAAEAGMSTVQFTRCFREHTGHAPSEFMVLARVERARLLLSTTSQSIAEIADALGYNDVYYFSRQFTQKTGTPPATFRKQKQVNRNPE